MTYKPFGEIVKNLKHLTCKYASINSGDVPQALSEKIAEILKEERLKIEKIIKQDKARQPAQLAQEILQTTFLCQYVQADLMRLLREIPGGNFEAAANDLYAKTLEFSNIL